MGSDYNNRKDDKKDSVDSRKNCNKSNNVTARRILGVAITLRNTSCFTADEVLRALEHVIFGFRFQCHTRIDVTVTNRYKDRFRGKCYGNGCSMHKPDPSRPLIIARITPQEGQFPRWIDRTPELCERVVLRHGNYVVETKKVSSGGYISCWLLDRMECLIHVLSHEFRHLWQMEHKRGRVWGARGKISERDADPFAIRKVREYRKLMQRQTSDETLSTASAFFSCLSLAISKKPLAIIDEDIKNQPMHFAAEDRLISLLHLENQLNLQSFVKHQSYDYNILERYVYCDIIPEEPVRRSSASESQTKEDDYSSC